MMHNSVNPSFPSFSFFLRENYVKSMTNFEYKLGKMFNQYGVEEKIVTGKLNNNLGSTTYQLSETNVFGLILNLKSVQTGFRNHIKLLDFSLSNQRMGLLQYHDHELLKKKKYSRGQKDRMGAKAFALYVATSPDPGSSTPWTIHRHRCTTRDQS